MEWYEAEVKALEVSSRPRPGAPPPVVFYGSSSIRLWTTLAEGFPELPVVNLGFGGSTLTACSWFFSRLVPPQKPKSLILYAGDNDLGDGRTPEGVLTSYRDLAKQVRPLLGEIPFTYLSIKSSPARFALTEKIKQTNEMIRREHTAVPGWTFLDVFSAMLGADGLPNRELYAPDGLHLGRAGYLVWTQILQRHPEIFALKSP